MLRSGRATSAAGAPGRALRLRASHFRALRRGFLPSRPLVFVPTCPLKPDGLRRGEKAEKLAARKALVPLLQAEEDSRRAPPLLPLSFLPACCPVSTPCLPLMRHHAPAESALTLPARQVLRQPDDGAGGRGADHAQRAGLDRGDERLLHWALDAARAGDAPGPTPDVGTAAAAASCRGTPNFVSCFMFNNVRSVLVDGSALVDPPTQSSPRWVRRSIMSRLRKRTDHALIK